MVPASTRRLRTHMRVQGRGWLECASCDGRLGRWAGRHAGRVARANMVRAAASSPKVKSQKSTGRAVHAGAHLHDRLHQLVAGAAVAERIKARRSVRGRAAWGHHPAVGGGRGRLLGCRCCGHGGCRGGAIARGVALLPPLLGGRLAVQLRACRGGNLAACGAAGTDRRWLSCAAPTAPASAWRGGSGDGDGRSCGGAGALSCFGCLGSGRCWAAFSIALIQHRTRAFSGGEAAADFCVPTA